jgi:hypothetical protein
MSSSSSSDPLPARRRFQFSLKALFLLVLICSVAAWFVSRRVIHARRVELATQLGAPADRLMSYVPYLQGEVDIVSGDYARKNMAICLLRRTGRMREDAPGIWNSLENQLTTYRHRIDQVEVLVEAGSRGGEGYEMTRAVFQIVLLEGALAIEHGDSAKADAKVSECVWLAKQYDDEVSQTLLVGEDALSRLASRILVAWAERIHARRCHNEANYIRALKDQSSLLERFIARLKTLSDQQDLDAGVYGAQLAHARVRARLAHSLGNDSAELAAWQDAAIKARTLRDISFQTWPPSDPGRIFGNRNDDWCGISYALLLSEPGLILAEAPQRARSLQACTAQQAALAEYEALCSDAVKKAATKDCPEFWECLESLAKLDLIEAGN